MPHRVIYSPRVVRDLEKIRAHLPAESANPEATNRYLAKMLDSCDSLAILPARYGVYPFARTWRMMPFQNYLIFFRIRKDSVLIGHIRHGSRRPFRK